MSKTAGKFYARSQVDWNYVEVESNPKGSSAVLAYYLSVNFNLEFDMYYHVNSCSEYTFLWNFANFI